MFERLSLVVATLPPTTPPVTQPVIAGEQPDDGAGFVSSFADVISAVVDNLGNNGYQTGIARGLGATRAQGSAVLC